MLFAQAYPLWSLMIMGVYLLAVYGLAVHGVRESAARSGSAYRSETTTTEASAASLEHLRGQRSGAPGGVAAPGVTVTEA